MLDEKARDYLIKTKFHGNPSNNFKAQIFKAQILSINLTAVWIICTKCPSS